MVLALGAKSTAATVTVYLSILLTALITYVVLSAASMVERRLGQTGMRILTRLMGLVLSAIAVQFIIDGIKLSFRSVSP
jgi:multiple antibiotic resistance protein